MDNLLLRFFLPTVDGSIHAVLQLTFAAIFLGSVVLTIIQVARQAKPEQWARRAANSDADEDSAIAHANVDELAATIATPAERWADILPSLLLVFGLLGTFIGLGLALTEAAGVLGPGTDALSGLTPIMDSLGSKFKTSTWGIIAFLFLKVWFMRNPYDEPRFAWAAHEVRRQATLEQARCQKERVEERQQLIGAIERSSASRYVEELVTAAHKQHEMDEARSKRIAQIVVGLEALRKQQNELVADARATSSNTARLVQSGEIQLQHLGGIAQDSAANRAAMDEFVASVPKNMVKMANAANKMSEAAEAAGTASSELGTVIGNFRETMTTVLSEVKTELGATMEGMNSTFSANMETMSGELTRATTGIENASRSSGEIMATVLGEVKTELGDTMKAMSETFSGNMEKMSGDLTVATTGIADAIGTMASGIEGTITTLENASRQSVERQAVAQGTFKTSGDALTGSIEMITSVVEALGTKIENSLASVSKSNMQLATFESELKKSSLNVNATLVIVEKLVAGINGQQVNTDQNALLQHRQLDEFIALKTRIVSLTESIDELTNVRKSDAGTEDGQRVAATLVRIEALLTSLAQSRSRAQRATDVLAA